jgi:beta-glucosidase
MRTLIALLLLLAPSPVAAQVPELLARMIPEEKFWQLYLHPGDSTVVAGPGRYGVQVGTTGNAVDAVRQLNQVQHRFVDRTRLGIPIIPVAEALHGVVAPGATVFPQAIGLAATWDTALMGAVATAIAGEARARGIRQVLSPVLNLATDGRWGRVEETYGEDPWLASRMGEAFIRPFELSGIVTTPKHFVANVGEGGRDSYPIELSEARLRRFELVPFEGAVHNAGARSIMAAYNSVAGRPASANAWLLRRLLKDEWGFPGVVISDAGGVGGANVLHGTATDYADATGQAMRAGLDVIFQGDAASAPLFKEAFDRGLVPAPVIDSAVARVLRLKFALGLFEHPFADEEAARQLMADTTAHALARRAAISSAVLLQNRGNLLPLDRERVRSIALIGVDAGEARFGGYSGSGNRVVSALEALRTRLGSARVRFAPGPGRSISRPVAVPASALHTSDGAAGLTAEYFAGPELSGVPRVTRVDQAVDFHWTFLPPAPGLAPDWFSVRWRGTVTAPTTGVVHLGLAGTDGYRLYLGDSLLIDAWDSERYTERLVPVRFVAGKAGPIRVEARIPGANARVRLLWDEGIVDRSETRIGEAVAAARQADVAVVMVGLEEGEFRDRASLALPGRQEELLHRVAATGKPVIVVIVGGGAVTMQSWIDRVGAVLDVWYPGEAGGEALTNLLFGDASPGGRLPITFPVSEGQLPLVYNHLPTGRGDDYDDLTGQAQFPFGYGLSYTRFTWSDLSIAPDTAAQGGVLVVRCTVKNSGTRAGDEVVQLYLHHPVATVAKPVLELKAFHRVTLAPGDSARIAFRVGTAEAEAGRLDLLLGASSRDIRLRGSAELR